MSPEIKKIIVLSGILIATSALFLTWNAQGAWDFILPLRAKKLAALLLVAYAIGVSTLLFQTITNNPILTPSILGFDTLYIFLQTLLVASLGSFGYTQLPLMAKFSFEIIMMIGGSLLLFSLLLKQGGRDLARMILIGVIFGVLFRSLSSLLQRMIDPKNSRLPKPTPLPASTPSTSTCSASAASSWPPARFFCGANAIGLMCICSDATKSSI